jgi:hypothetical protein
MTLRHPNTENRYNSHNRTGGMRRVVVSLLVALVMLAGSLVSSEPAAGRVLGRWGRPKRSHERARVATPQVQPMPVDNAEVTEPKAGVSAGEDVAATCEAGYYLDFQPWLRHQDSLYLVDTRCLGCPCSTTDVRDLPIYRYDTAAHVWRPASVAQLAHDAEGSVTSIHIHGNRIDEPVAIERGWAVYHAWVRHDANATPLTFVIWSWPSSRIRGQLRDVRVKAERTDIECVYVARLVSALPADARISMTGHSYGARIISGAAHLIAGCDLGGCCVAGETAGPPRNIRAVFTAAAMHDYWLSPGCFHGCALTQMDRVLNLYNSRDRALRFYRHIERGAHPAALGYSGAVFCGDDGGLSNRVDQVNVVRLVGNKHGFLYYLRCPEITDLAADYVLFQPVD